jgi:hypothetical protein
VRSRRVRTRARQGRSGLDQGASGSRGPTRGLLGHPVASGWLVWGSPARLDHERDALSPATSAARRMSAAASPWRSWGTQTS